VRSLDVTLGRPAVAVGAVEVSLPRGIVGEMRAQRRASASRLTLRGGLLVALVMVACLVFASSAVALKPVPGSPFATGSYPVSVAFSPGGELS
jgi:hypothetical protein